MQLIFRSSDTDSCFVWGGVGFYFVTSTMASLPHYASKHATISLLEIHRLVYVSMGA